MEKKREECVDEIVNSAMKNLKEIVSSNTVIGVPMQFEEVSLVPISKVSVGFVAGGGEVKGKDKGQKVLPFTGGSGTGFTVTPVGVIVITKGDVRFLQIDKVDATAELLKSANKMLTNIMKGKSDDKEVK